MNFLILAISITFFSGYLHAEPVEFLNVIRYIRPNTTYRLMKSDFSQAKGLKRLDIYINQKNLGRQVWGNLELPEGIFDKTSIEEVYINAVIPHLKAEAFKGAKNLKKIVLADGKVIKADVDLFRFIPQLEKLSIGDNSNNYEFPIDQPGIFATAPNLKQFYLHTPKAPAEGFFNNLAALEKLEIYAPLTITESTFGALTALKDLLVSSPVITTLPPMFISRATGLKTIMLKLPNLKSIGELAFSDLSELQSLSIKSSSVTIAENAFQGLIKLKRIGHLTSEQESLNLTELPVNLFRDLINLEYLALSVGNTVHSGSFKSQGNLVRLSLGGHEPSAGGLEGLSNLQHLTIITTSFFPDNYFSPLKNLMDFKFYPWNSNHYDIRNAGFSSQHFISICIEFNCSAPRSRGVNSY